MACARGGRGCTSGDPWGVSAWPGESTACCSVGMETRTTGLLKHAHTAKANFRHDILRNLN